MGRGGLHFWGMGIVPPAIERLKEDSMTRSSSSKIKGGVSGQVMTQEQRRKLSKKLFDIRAEEVEKTLLHGLCVRLGT